MPTQTEDTNNQPYRITRWTLFKAIVNYLFKHAFLIYYTYSYTTIPKELAHTNLSICFLVYIVLCYVANIPALIEIFCVMRHMGEMTTKNLWSVILPTNRYPWAVVKWSTTGCLGLGCYFLSKFIPVGTDHCDIYADGVSPDACISLQMISVFTIIALIAIGLVLLILLVFGCVMCCLICKDEDFSFSRLRSHYRETSVIGTLSSVVTSQLPIVTTPPHDKTCAICFADAQEGEQWMELTCKHKFHPDCITPWLSEHSTCPLCRAVQSPV